MHCLIVIVLFLLRLSSHSFVLSSVFVIFSFIAVVFSFLQICVFCPLFALIINLYLFLQNYTHAKTVGKESYSFAKVSFFFPIGYSIFVFLAEFFPDLSQKLMSHAIIFLMHSLVLK